MRQQGILTRLAVIALLAASVFNASFEAKLYLYRTEPARAQVASKAIKFVELRMERATPAQPVARIEEEAFLTTPSTVPVRPVSLPRRILSIPRSHWFRPPPYSSISDAA